MTVPDYRHIDGRFARHAESHWGHLSRLNNMLIIMNISMFFLTDLVVKQGYYYTYYSLICLAVAASGPLMPIGLLHRLWYYLIFLLCEIGGIYFLVASIVYWVRTNGG